MKTFIQVFVVWSSFMLLAVGSGKFMKTAPAIMSETTLHDKNGVVYYVVTNGTESSLMTPLLTSNAGVTPKVYKPVVLISNATPKTIYNYISKQNLTTAKPK